MIHNFEPDPLYSLESEQALIGTLLHSPEAFERIEDKVSGHDFFRENHRILFMVIADQFNKGQAYDILTICHQLKAHDRLNTVGGQEYVAHLAHTYFSYSNIEAYATIIRDKSLLRQLQGFSHKVLERCQNPEGESSQDIIDAVEKAFTEISLANGQGRDHVISVTDALSSTLEHLEKLIGAKGGITGHPTEWIDFDQKTLGLHGGDMSVIAGRPSMGKTTFALNMVERVTANTGLPSLIFSMEMPKEQLMLKLLSSIGSIDQTALRSGTMGDLDLRRLKEATVKLSKLPIHIDDRGLLTTSDIRSTARKFIRQQGSLGIIMVDYLQLIHTNNKQSELRAIEVAEISRSLKLLARELNVPVVVLSQLNRSLEQRPNKRPIMSDIRESGAIEQDADNIISEAETV